MDFRVISRSILVGFVIVRDRLDKICVIRPAAMQGRSIIEWDKDDIDALGLLKIDVLALGMLSCLAGAFQLMQQHYYRRLSLASIPPEDKQTYDMLCRGESVGVFQVESRAQMAMLPRLQPRSFHDLVIQVAIVRPRPYPRRYGASLFAQTCRARACQLSI
jgi:error-prone DNA polymerase